MSITVTSYLKYENQFIDTRNFDKEIKDHFYIPGAIQILHGVHEICGTDQWDYVDQLWSYIVDGLESVANGTSFACYFPDQPIPLGFDIIAGNNIKLSITTYMRQEAVIAKREFIDVFSAAGLVFFNDMIRIIPEDSLYYIGNIEKLRILRADSER
jgi:hypothetical protein